MTISEMHYAVKQKLQKIDSNATFNFLDDEIDFWLNRAQDRFVKQRFYWQSNSKQRGYEQTQKRLDDIRVISEINFEDDVTADPAAAYQRFDLPHDYCFLVNLRMRAHLENCKTVSVSSPIVEVPVRLVEQDKIYEMLRDPFAKSTHISPLGVINTEDVTIFQGERFILVGISMDYIRKPSEVNLTSCIHCELASHTHDEIVDIAVKMMLEATESPRYQTNTIESAGME